MTSSFWSGRAVLVTGGCGFSGAHLVRHLVRLGARVRVADDLSHGSLERIADVRDAVDFRRLDLTRRDDAAAACDGVEIAFHLAAIASGLRYSSRHHATMLTANALLALHVLEEARAAGVGRYVLFSSSCVYGDDAPVPTPEAWGTVGDPERTHSGYGWAKRVAELQARLVALEHPMTVTALRPVNVCGFGEHFDLETGHVIPALIRKALAADGALDVMGSGAQTRSFIDARDLADIAIRVAERGGRIEALNVSSPREVSIAEVARLVVQAAGRPELAVRFDPREAEGARRKMPDLSALHDFLGDFAFTPLEESVAGMVDDYRQRRPR